MSQREPGQNHEPTFADREVHFSSLDFFCVISGVGSNICNIKPPFKKFLLKYERENARYTTSNPVEILFSTLINCRHYPALDLLLHLETYILYRRFARWNKSQQMKNVINGSALQKSTNNLRKLFIIMFNNWFENGCNYYNWN